MSYTSIIGVDMEYMESKMQDYMEAGDHECNELLVSFGPPQDWLTPKWDELDKVHNWRNYASVGVQGEWPNLTGRMRIILSANFQEIADCEEWD